jgi:Rrf2 family nitric oxide-sensitive transcriptional repressor
LARSAKEISIGHVLRATEPEFALVGCMRGEPCTIVDCCRLPKVFAAAIQAFLDVSDRYVLADLVVPQADMLHELAEVRLCLKSTSSSDA